MQKVAKQQIHRFKVFFKFHRNETFHRMAEPKTKIDLLFGWVFKVGI